MVPVELQVKQVGPVVVVAAVVFYDVAALGFDQEPNQVGLLLLLAEPRVVHDCFPATCLEQGRVWVHFLGVLDQAGRLRVHDQGLVPTRENVTPAPLSLAQELLADLLRVVLASVEAPNHKMNVFRPFDVLKFGLENRNRLDFGCVLIKAIHRDHLLNLLHDLSVELLA